MDYQSFIWRQEQVDFMLATVICCTGPIAMSAKVATQGLTPERMKEALEILEEFERIESVRKGLSKYDDMYWTMTYRGEDIFDLFSDPRSFGRVAAVLEHELRKEALDCLEQAKAAGLDVSAIQAAPPYETKWGT
ncbi:MAG: hypothetical protein ACKVP3_00570 [Hyphomicrobiaceae bacterium]